ncbi:MAG: hypothetical protein O3A33_08020 [Chloroflexi bacterium]|nr:hypothetical protein [Chloroflexota bacterium]
MSSIRRASGPLEGPSEHLSDIGMHLTVSVDLSGDGYDQPTADFRTTERHD